MTEFKLPDMSCGHCAGRVTQALQQVDPACRLDFNLRERSVQVHSTAAPEALAAALRAAGYAPA